MAFEGASAEGGTASKLWRVSLRGETDRVAVAKAAKAFEWGDGLKADAEFETLASFATIRAVCYRGSNLLLSIGASSGAEPSGAAMVNVP